MNAVSKNNRFTGSIADELTHVQAEIRNKPNAVELRVYLFQLLCLLGQWQRAVTQLQTCLNVRQIVIDTSNS